VGGDGRKIVIPIFFCRQLIGIKSENWDLKRKPVLWFLQRPTSCVSFSKLFHTSTLGKTEAKTLTKKTDFSPRLPWAKTKLEQHCR
jgi:hypothetical protein